MTSIILFIRFGWKAPEYLGSIGFGYLSCSRQEFAGEPVVVDLPLADRERFLRLVQADKDVFFVHDGTLSRLEVAELRDVLQRDRGPEFAELDIQREAIAAQPLRLTDVYVAFAVRVEYANGFVHEHVAIVSRDGSAVVRIPEHFVKGLLPEDEPRDYG